MTEAAFGLAAAVATALVLWMVLRSRVVAGALVVLAATVIFPTAAGATASSITVTAWLGASECEQTHIYINNTAGYPHLDAYGAGYYVYLDHYGKPYCETQSGVRFPSGYVVTREDLYAWDPEINGWVACNYGPMVYNGVPTYISKTGYNWPYPAACYSYDYYFGAGYGAVYNAGWKGGWHNTPASVYVV